MDYQSRLLNWYDQNHRKLPWRETNDPYKIWISEIMLQQTQVNTVIDYYNRFIKAYPDVYSLSRAEEDDVFKLWEGLGYYSRAKNMMLCAREIVDKHHGEFPGKYQDALALSGVGPYTVGAVLSIAYNMSFPAVDGNVMRVISRQFNIGEDISQPGTRKTFEEKVKTLLPEDRRSFNQALMELGAVICLPQNPKCEICPVHDLCLANELHIQQSLPVKTKKTKKIKQTMALAYVKHQDTILLVRRPKEGLMGNLWGFPIIESEKETQGYLDIQWELKENYGIQVQYIQEKSKAKHIFTHRIWEMTLYEFTTSEKKTIEFPEVVWVKEEQINQYAVPTAFRKLLK